MKNLKGLFEKLEGKGQESSRREKRMKKKVAASTKPEVKMRAHTTNPWRDHQDKSNTAQERYFWQPESVTHVV